MQVCVDAQTIASVISGWTGIPAGKMMTDEIRTVLAVGVCGDGPDARPVFERPCHGQTVPVAADDTTSILPPWALAISVQMYKPRPKPPPGLLVLGRQ